MSIHLMPPLFATVIVPEGKYAGVCTSTPRAVGHLVMAEGRGVSQPFVPGKSYTIKRIDFELAKYAEAKPCPPKMYLGVYNTGVDQVPTGSPLASKTFVPSCGDPDEWIAHQVLINCNVSLGTTYALSWRVPTPLTEPTDVAIQIRYGENHNCLPASVHAWYWDEDDGWYLDAGDIRLYYATYELT